MPRLVKGAKWTYGWVLVGSQGEVTIPPEAWREFGFRAGDEAVFTPGGISTPALMAQARQRLRGGTLRVLARGRFDDGGRVAIPPELGVRPGDRLLTVRGSCYGLGFVAQGPIHEEALRHPELECFGEASET